MAPSNEPGGNSSKIHCTGFAPYEVMLVNRDNRSWLNVIYNKTEIDLYADTSEVKPGDSFFNKANDVVEWRGMDYGEKFIPYAIIYRLSGTAHETQKTCTRLIVIHLDKGQSGVVGIAEGKGEEAEARTIADKYKP